MLDYGEGTIALGNQTEKITMYVVWFITPRGLSVNITDAQHVCDANDFPYTLIRPVAVAIGDKGMYEVCG